MSTTPTNPIVEMQVNGTWVDITADCRLQSAESGGGFEITRGVPNEGGTAEPTQFNFVLNNGVSKAPSTAGQTGVYSAMNAAGPYFGLLGRNQRVRVGIDRRIESWLRSAAIAGGLGSLPTQYHTDGTPIPGEQWHFFGSPANWSTSGAGQAVVTGATGNKIATYRKLYGDVDVLMSFIPGGRDTEMGIILRMADYSMDAGPALDPSFETGMSSWVTGSNSVLAQDTSVFHEGSASGRLTVTATGTTATMSVATAPSSMYAGAYPGRSYTVRAWVRASYAASVQVNLWCYNTASVNVGNANTTIVVAANTWTLVDATLITYQDAAYIKPSFVLTGSPAIGAQLWVDAVEILDQNNPSWYSAYVTPGTTDVLQIGKVAPAVSRSVNYPIGFQIVAGTEYWMRAQISGPRLRVKLWADGSAQPPSWQLRYTDTVTATEPLVGATGEVGIISNNGTSGMTITSLRVDQWRAHTEIATLPPRWDKARVDRWVPIQSRGILRRLGQGRKALKSAVSLHLQSYVASSYGWWPLEDDVGTVAGNNTDGPTAPLIGMEFSTPDLTGPYALPGVSGYATLTTDTSSFSAAITNRPGNGKETMLWFFRLPAFPASDHLICTMTSTGTVRTWRVWLQLDGGLRVNGYDQGGNLLVNSTTVYLGGTDLPVGCWVACTLYLNQVGSNITFALNVHRPGGANFYSNNGTVTGATVGNYTGIKFQGSTQATTAGGISITQVMHYAGDLPFVTDDFAKASVAYDQETATLRLLRLGANAGISVSTTGPSGTSTPMGQQSQSKLLDLMNECAAVEDGFLLEDRDDYQLTLVTRKSLWDRVPHVLDIDAGHLSDPLEPSTDDQQTRNDVTVSRPNGGFGRSIQASGPLNINPPETDVDGVGTYDEQVTVNLGTDALTQQLADWRRSKGTMPDPRYPSMHADLAASVYQSSPALAAATSSIDVGDVITLVNPEADYIPREQIVTGYTEVIDLYDWDLTWTTLPNATRRVGVVSYTTRVDTEDQFADGPIVVGTDTRISVFSDSGHTAWVTLDKSDVHFPFDVLIDGAQLRVEMVGDVMNLNPGFETGDLTGWQVTGATISAIIDTYNPKRGVYNARLAPTGSPTYPLTGGIVQTAATQRAAVAGRSYRVCGWVRPESVPSALMVTVEWYNASSALLSTAAPTPISTGSGSWVWFDQIVVAPASTAFARVKLLNTWAASYRVWVDDIRLVDVRTYDGSTGEQILSIQAAPINWVYKTIGYNKQVRLAAPWRVGMGILGQ